jgi:hypothetical protein
MKTILILFAVCLIAATANAGRTKRSEQGKEPAAGMEIAEHFGRVKRQDADPAVTTESSAGSGGKGSGMETTTAGASGIFKASTPIFVLIAVITSLLTSIKM